MPASLGIPIPAAVAERAFTNWEPSPSGCHISTYSTASHGYAQIGWADDNGKRHGTTAHRAAWYHVHGLIAESITIDHQPTCDQRCVNTDHLRELSNFENSRRTHGRDWPLGQCARGHSNEHLFEQWEAGKGRNRLRCSECRRMDGKTTRERIKTDPIRLKRNRESMRQSKKKRRANPEKYAAELATNRERARRKREAKTTNDDRRTNP